MSRNIGGGRQPSHTLTHRVALPGDTPGFSPGRRSYDSSTLPVYAVETDPVDRIQSLLTLDFNDFTGGMGPDAGAVVFLPSDLASISRDDFLQGLVHEVGHTAFDLPDSAVSNDAMTYNHTSNDTKLCYGLPSRLLVERRTQGELKVEKVEQGGRTGIRYREILPEVSEDLAAEAVTRNVQGFIRGLADSFDLDMGDFNGSNHRRNDSEDVVVFEDYNGLNLDMRVSVDTLITDVEPVRNV